MWYATGVFLNCHPDSWTRCLPWNRARLVVFHSRACIMTLVAGHVIAKYHSPPQLHKEELSLNRKNKWLSQVWMRQFFNCEWFCHAWFAYTDASCSLKMAQLCLVMTISPSLRPLGHDSRHIASQSFSHSQMANQVKQIQMQEQWSCHGHKLSYVQYILHLIWPPPMMLLQHIRL